MKPEHQSIIDEALQRIVQEELTQAQIVGLSVQDRALQQSTLRIWLTELAEIAEQGGLGTHSQKEAREMLDGVYKAFCQAPYQPYPLIPPAFDRSPLGALLNQARVYALGLSDVVNVAEAAKLTQVQRAQIYFLTFGGILHPIEINGKVMIERRELERVEDYKKDEGSRSSKGG